ncbi:MAG: outer membrane beta-barrel protein [Flavisolibacter sp.]
MKSLFSILILLTCFKALSQKDNSGIIVGTVLNDESKALEGATVQLINFNDTIHFKTLLTDKDGAFSFEHIAFGYYKLRISFTGFQPVSLDSIHLRAERFDFNLNDIILKPNTNTNLEEVIIYVEKPLVESKDGNVTFNAGESALSAGSNASDLLTNVPLVTKDASGQLLVRGKEPKILIDDKPVELNLQQLQDLLESMPGSSIEKIEVMTNPPPQYANEEGGVINIVTKKGAVGVRERLSLYGGTRGERGTNGSFSYRRQGFSVNVNAGAGYSNYEGNAYSKRLNTDSSQFNTASSYNNKSLRPNFRANINYDLNKSHSLNLVLQYNQNNFDNVSGVEYKNTSPQNIITRLSNRTVNSKGESYSPNITLSYTFRTKRAGETFRLISNINSSDNETRRSFFEQFFNPDYSFSGKDSTQQQTTNNNTKGNNIRLNYDLPLLSYKTFFSLGGYRNAYRSDIESNAFYKRHADGEWTGLEALTNHFIYHQYITNVRGSVKQMFGESFSATAGLSLEQTKVQFDLFKTTSTQKNNYWNYLPFAMLNKKWNDVLNLSFSYRRTMRRPGVNEQNPIVDSSDQFNIRYGNPELKPSLSHNFDLVLGRSKNGFYANIGLGFNSVEDVFSRLRITPTEITWQKISGLKEYEISSWSGFSASRKVKINFSASYIYNAYSAFDKETRNFRDGGSFTSNLNTNFTWKDLYNATGSFTFNRFANPQGTAKSSLSMNLGLQAKLLQKKLTATLNIIDPFKQQQNRSYTYGTSFTQENYSTTQTRNFRLSLGYTFGGYKKKKTDRSVQKALDKMLPAFKS